MIQVVTVTARQIQVALVGDIQEEGARALRENLIEYIDQGHKSILLDFTRVDHIDLYGLATIIAIHKLVLGKTGYLEITGLQGRVKDLFEGTQLNNLLNIK